VRTGEVHPITGRETLQGCLAVIFLAGSKKELGEGVDDSRENYGGWGLTKLRENVRAKVQFSSTKASRVNLGSDQLHVKKKR